MPKFLDVPSWYDEYGKENSSIGAQTIGVDVGTTVDISSLSAGIYKLKYTGDYSQNGTVTFALSSSLSLKAQFAPPYLMGEFNNSWFELGERNPSLGSNALAQMLTFHNMCISSNYSSSVSSNMTISPDIGRNFTLQLNYMDTGSGMNMYAASVVDAGFSVTLPGVSNTMNSHPIYTPTSGGTSGQILFSSGSGASPVFKDFSWEDIEMNSSSISSLEVSDNVQTLRLGSYYIYNHNLVINNANSVPGYMIRIYTSIMSSSYSTAVTSKSNLINLISSGGFTSYTFPIPVGGVYKNYIAFAMLISTGNLIFLCIGPSYSS